jgi:hypothetical protein
MYDAVVNIEQSNKKQIQQELQTAGGKKRSISVKISVMHMMKVENNYSIKEY